MIALQEGITAELIHYKNPEFWELELIGLDDKGRPFALTLTDRQLDALVELLKHKEAK